MTAYQPADPSRIRSVYPGADYTPMQKPDHHYEEVGAAVPVKDAYLIPNPEYVVSYPVIIYMCTDR